MQVNWVKLVSVFVNQTCEKLLGDARGSCQFRQFLHECLYEEEFDFSKAEVVCQNFSKKDLFNCSDFSTTPIFPLLGKYRWLEEVEFGKDGDRMNQPIRDRGHVLYKIAETFKIPTKAVCQFFAMWKKSDNQRQAYDFHLRKFLNSKKFNKKAETPPLPEKEEELSVHETDLDNSSDSESSLGVEAVKVPHCDNCYASNPDTLIPTSIFQGRHSKKRREMFCKSCGTWWLKYATTKPVPRETKSNNKGHLFESGKKSKQRESSNHQTSFQAVPPRSIVPHIPCGVCLDDIKTDEDGKVENIKAVKCVSCKIAVHKICYDIPRPIHPLEEWQCDVCISNVSKEPGCCLCGKVDPQVNAYKTFQGNIAHAVCLYSNESFMFCKENGIRQPILYKDIVDTQDITCFYCHQKVGWKTCCVMQGCAKWFHPVCATRASAAFTYFKKAMRFFCSDHMTPLVPFDIHDPPNSIKDVTRASRMTKVQEELRYNRTELGSVTAPDFDRNTPMMMYSDPKIDINKANIKRAMRKSSAHMKVPEFPPCCQCMRTAFPVLWISESWKCLKCVRISLNSEE
eukprot:NODE_9_length_64580_cov_1.431941.p9 type:complete len:568 gc:universal NODE_9_length_64580_cov_1.431941:36941-38644(+)